MIHGLGGALFEAIQFANGRSPIPDSPSIASRASATLPQIEAVLLDRKDIPSAGAGETPTHGRGPSHRQRHLRRHRRPSSQLPLIPAA